MAIRKAFELESVDGDDFHAAIVGLGEKHPSVAPTLFQVIERLGAGDEPLQSDTLKALIATFKAVLHEMYVLGQERRETMAYLSQILQALDGDKMLAATARTASAAINLEQLLRCSCGSLSFVPKTRDGCRCLASAP